MKYGISVPNLAEFTDARRFATLAQRAEATGWDGLFVWDHVVFPFGELEVADPWLLLTAAALATERIRLGPMVTPVARRRPGTLARQTTSLDRLSAGRLTFGAGLGWTLPAEFGSWGDSVDPRELAARLDEGLTVLTALWSGARVDYQGTHLTVTDVIFRPTPVQRPRPPVWIACEWPHRRPLRRAARWDGVVALVVDPRDGSWRPTPEVVADIVAAVPLDEGRADPFDVVITGSTDPDDPDRARDTVAALARAGATWWLEGFRPQPGAYEAAVRRIEVGPPG